jgi:hypothetical protein
MRLWQAEVFNNFARRLARTPGAALLFYEPTSHVSISIAAMTTYLSVQDVVTTGANSAALLRTTSCMASGVRPVKSK